MKIESSLPIEMPKQNFAEIKPIENKLTSEDLREIAIKKQSDELEAVFLTQLIKSMEKTIPEGMGGSKNSLSTMMFSSILGDAMSDGGGIGLSKMIYSSLKKMDSTADLQELGGSQYLQSLSVLQNLKSLGDSE